MDITQSQWLIAGGAVVLAGILQTSTGAGLGLIVGPVLLLVLGTGSAIDVSIILNLAISLIIAPWEYREVDRRSLKILSIGTILGIPFGLLVTSALSLNSLKLFAAIAIGVGVIQILLSRKMGVRSETRVHRQVLLFGGTISGIMSSSLAMPGPIATWAMLKSGLTASSTRATLRLLFLISYSAALISRASRGVEWSEVFIASLQLSLPLLIGIGIGLFVKEHLNETLLRKLLLAILAVVALSLAVNLLFQ